MKTYEMKELEILIETIERDLEILSRLPMIMTKNPPRCLQDEKRKEIETIKSAIEIFERYKSCLIEAGLI